MDSKKNVAIIGGGNIGLAIAEGLENSKLYSPASIYITRRNINLLKSYEEKGYKITDDNKFAVANSEIIIISVQPKQLDELLIEIKELIDSNKHLIISIVSGAEIKVF
jgi:pyrroline-5-carboxylate reductase